MAKQPMLDLVPFAGSRWEVAYLDFQAKVVAQLLQFHFPQPIAATVAAATVGRDQQTRCLRMASLSQFVPPASNGRDRELGGVAADADAHPGLVVTQVVDSVGDRLALAWVRKIMHIDLGRLSFGPPGSARILLISHGFLLLRVDRDRWLTVTVLCSHPTIDVAKLLVAIGVVGPFTHFPVSLQAIAGMLEQARHRGAGHQVTLSRQLLCQASCALARPAQRSLRVASGGWLDQPLQRSLQPWLHAFRWLTPATRSALPRARRGVGTLQLLDAALDRAPRDTRSHADNGNSSSAQRNRFDRSPTPAREFGQLTRKTPILVSNPFDNALIRHVQRCASERVPESMSI